MSSTEQLDGSTNSMDMDLNKFQVIVKEGKPDILQSMGSQSWTWLSNLTATTKSHVWRGDGKWGIKWPFGEGQGLDK